MLGCAMRPWARRILDAAPWRCNFVRCRQGHHSSEHQQSSNVNQTYRRACPTLPVLTIATCCSSCASLLLAAALASLPPSTRTAGSVSSSDRCPCPGCRPGERERVHVWVAGEFRKAGEDQAMRILEEAGIQRPVSVLPVGGNKPGWPFLPSGERPTCRSCRPKSCSE